MVAPPPQFRPVVRTIREELAEQRQRIRQCHRDGVPAVQVCAQWADVCDSALLALFRDAWEVSNPPDRPVVLVAHGGYGRRDGAPFSDVDLMLLHDERQNQVWSEFAKRFTQTIYDVGLDLGFSLRTVAECVTQSQRDIRVLTSLLESRYLAGDRRLFARYHRRFRRFVARSATRCIPETMAARRAERRQFGDTVYLLEPNLKRSRGGLRDIQFVSWIGGIRVGTTDLSELRQHGLMSREDHRELVRAREFLLWLRNELHDRANRAQDVLSRHEQLRIAAMRGYPESPAERPVEAFMRDYFAHTRAVRDVSRHFYETVRPRSRALALLEPVISHRVARDYVVGPVHIRARPATLPRLAEDVSEVLRLMDLANWYDRRIDYRTWQTIRAAMKARDDLALSPVAAQRFMSFLSHPARLAALLRRLHELRVLEVFVPAMRHAWCLVQFNEYHKYTVDEHSLLAVQRATEFFERDDALGEAYRQLQPKHLLHLGLLLHDLGKGFPRDHSEVGGELAAETAKRLGLSARETAILRVLVEKHLLMSHLAQQHNVYDEATWLRLAREVGSPFVLQMLYVLTCADLAAVGKGVLTEWKLKLITDLYLQTRAHLTVDSNEQPSRRMHEQKHQAVMELVRGMPQADPLTRRLGALPKKLLIAEPPERLVELLQRLSDRATDDVIAWADYDPARRTTLYTVAAPAEVVPGAFHRLAGGLATCGLQVYGADIFTLDDDLLLDRFAVEDPDFEQAPPQDRLDSVCDVLRRSLLDPSDQPPTFRNVWTSGPQQQPIRDMPVRVRFDNATSPHSTIVAVFAYDRRGLLYDIGNALFSLGLSVQSAKIGTHLDQVTDVFYIVDADGQKISDEAALERIRSALLEAVDEPVDA